MKRYLSHCPVGGLALHSTAKQAEKRAERSLRGHLEAGDMTDYDVQNIVWGEVRGYVKSKVVVGDIDASVCEIDAYSSVSTLVPLPPKPPVEVDALSARVLVLADKLGELEQEARDRGWHDRAAAYRNAADLLVHILNPPEDFVRDLRPSIVPEAERARKAQKAARRENRK